MVLISISCITVVPLSYAAALFLATIIRDFQFGSFPTASCNDRHRFFDRRQIVWRRAKVLRPQRFASTVTALRLSPHRICPGAAEKPLVSAFVRLWKFPSTRVWQQLVVSTSAKFMAADVV
jgi:hypothetical protein